MPLFMDRHYIAEATRHAIQNAHSKDLEVQGKYQIKFLTYWFDEARSTAFCLVDAPDRESIRMAHAEAHGSVPGEIIEVDPAVVEAFLGRIKEPVPAAAAETAPVPAEGSSAFRIIMCTDLKESTALTVRLGDARAMRLLHIHNAILRTAFRENGGREVRHTGDGIIASFRSAGSAVQCAVAIQQAFQEHNRLNREEAMHVRIGLSAGEPVEEDNSLFGTAVILAVRICAHAQPNRIVAAKVVKDLCAGTLWSFTAPGEAVLKGFPQPVSICEVEWGTDHVPMP